MTRAVFLDRDGTLIEEVGYLDRLDRLSIYPYTVDAVRLLNRAGFTVIVISNQSGIGRGVVRESFVAEAHAHLSTRLAAGGAVLNGFYYCPHHPEASIAAFRQRCACRKPSAGMLITAATEHGLDLPRSFVVGDRWDDVGAARAAGAKGVLVRSGYGREAEAAPKPGVSADYIADNLAGAAAWILSQP
jgi:D-glycero-D-manno-heptose 1,7-bisphosphate phosphatase